MSTPVSEETSVAVALTRMDGRLETIQLSLNHQTELMGRNRDEAMRDISECKADIVLLKARTDVLEKTEEQRKGAVRLAVAISSIVGGIGGAGVMLLTKLV